MAMDKRRTSARNTAISPHMVTLLLRLALTSNLLSNNLPTAMPPRPATLRVRTHNSMLIPDMDKDTHLELSNHTVELSRILHDLLIPSNSNSHNISLRCKPSLNLKPSLNINLSCNLNFSRSRSRSLSRNLSLNPNPKLISSNSIIPRQPKLPRRPNLRGKVNPEQRSLVRHTCMIHTPRTRIQMFKRGPNTTPKEAKTPRELFTSSRCLG